MPQKLLLSLVCIWIGTARPALIAQENRPENFKKANLIAWCIVPFDALERTPGERAQMLKRLGLQRVAYDWRDKHVQEFEEEIRQYQENDLEYFAFWGEHEEAFRLFEKHDLHPQIWKMLPQPKADNEEANVQWSATELLPLVKRTQELGCFLGIYNHGGWSGQPENMIRICDYLRKHHQAEHVGIVYNLHHGHQDMAKFREHLTSMLPYLLCLNLNGMNAEGDQKGQKILPLGAGELDGQLLEIVLDLNYRGPIGILGHTQDDVELRLKDNLDGLDWLISQRLGIPKERPSYRTYPAKKGSR